MTDPLHILAAASSPDPDGVHTLVDTQGLIIACILAIKIVAQINFKSDDEAQDALIRLIKMNWSAAGAIPLNKRN